MIKGRAVMDRTATTACRTKPDEEVCKSLLEDVESILLDTLQRTAKDDGIKIHVGITVEHTVPAVDVYSRRECIFTYCPDEKGCKGNDKCAHPNQTKENEDGEQGTGS